MWSDDDLRTIGNATELELASLRADDSLRTYVTIWVIRAGNELFVRAGYGRDSYWFRRAHQRLAGTIRAGGAVREVTFEEPGSSVDAAVTAAYHAKYDSHGATNVSPMVTPEAATATLRLVPRR